MSSLFDDNDDDLSLRTRRTETAAYADDHAPARQTPPHDRELTLNTGMVLAIFFALALVCAAFFGFGYSIGHKSGMTAAATTDTSAETAAASDAAASTPSGPKPAPGSPVTAPANAVQASGGQSTGTTAAPGSATRVPVLPIEPTPQITPSDPPSRPAPIVRIPVVSTATPASSAADGIASSYVQIAAVSHQEDAQELVLALQRRGYRVILRSEPADHLIHVQIGPFPTRKDAEPTKQKLVAEGYNAFIK